MPSLGGSPRAATPPPPPLSPRSPNTPAARDARDGRLALWPLLPPPLPLPPPAVATERTPLLGARPRGAPVVATTPAAGGAPPWPWTAPPPPPPPPPLSPWLWPPWLATAGGMSSGSSVCGSVGGGKGRDDDAAAVTGVVRLPSLESPVEVAEWVAECGFPQYRDAFLGHAVSGVILRSLTSEDLRDELGVRPLRHRRAFLAAIDQLNDEEAAGTPHAGHVGGTFSSLPEFGRVLTHLSNVRTAHSWCRLAVQQLILALGVVRLGVVEAADERDVLYRLVLAVCAAWCVVGVGFAVYGGWRFLRVTSILDSAEMQTSKFYPDRVGVVLSQLLLLFVASCIVILICVQVFFTIPLLG
ncbi:hypothetical protein I4F81_007586 [Pyropia yezoensis]|uniref:Uncharacterized protein n=1 Tax=Pyropia yezoensis TaxID=2788 RepID=A0ACC3C449_PYRYE|nr:hypothetical protein I4F81_007586 [Neopyropia yezoensis]